MSLRIRRRFHAPIWLVEIHVDKLISCKARTSAWPETWAVQVRRKDPRVRPPCAQTLGEIQARLHWCDPNQPARHAYDAFDPGDFAGATGKVMKTRSGEISVEVSALTML